jgi:hypothetical protein
MKHKTWFRLVLKAIGILLIGFALPDVVTHVIGYARWTAYQRSMMMGEPFDWVNFGMAIAAPSLQVAFGLYLLFGGAWLANLCIPSNRAYCAECGYELSQVESKRCPECGTAIAQPAPASD